MSEFQVEGTTETAVWLRCLHGGLRACHQRINQAFDGQPGSKQSDIVPASELEQYQGASYSVTGALLNGRLILCVVHITLDRGVFRDTPTRQATERKTQCVLTSLFSN